MSLILHYPSNLERLIIKCQAALILPDAVQRDLIDTYNIGFGVRAWGRLGLGYHHFSDMDLFPLLVPPQTRTIVPLTLGLRP